MPSNLKHKKSRINKLSESCDLLATPLMEIKMNV